jgi:bifunctional DNase/RNase
VTANTGYTSALAFTTNPATYTSADVRGTYKMQTAPSGAVHLAVYMNVPVYEATGANLLNYAQLFGLTQT